MIKRLIGFALDQPLFVILGLFVFIGAGVIAFQNLPVEAFMAPMGLWTLKMGFDGTFERVETPLVEQYRRAATSQQVGAIGQR